MRIRLDLAYDGTDFAGWQLQPGRDTLQGRVEEALRRLYRVEGAGGRPIPVAAAGRTDAGVHAEQQVVHFDAPRPIPPNGIVAGGNRLLPGSVRIMAATRVGPAFHARFDSIGKTYRYYLLAGEPASPLRCRFAWAAGRDLSRSAMERAAAAFVGRHDYRAFFTAPARDGRPGRFRTVQSARVFARGGFLVFEVGAEGFLRYMVRRMAGTLAAVGRGQLPPERVGEMLRNPDRPGPRFRAPAAGLRLFRVHFPGDPDGTGTGGG